MGTCVTRRYDSKGTFLNLGPFGCVKTHSCRHTSSGIPCPCSHGSCPRVCFDCTTDVCVISQCQCHDLVCRTEDFFEYIIDSNPFALSLMFVKEVRTPSHQVGEGSVPLFLRETSTSLVKGFLRWTPMACVRTQCVNNLTPTGKCSPSDPHRRLGTEREGRVVSTGLKGENTVVNPTTTDEPRDTPLPNASVHTIVPLAHNTS